MTELALTTDAATNYARAPRTERLAYTWELAKAGALLPRTATDRVETFEEQAGRVFYLAELGAMMGIHPLEALNGIHLIEGKPSISSALMSALVRKAGHKLRVAESGSWRARDYVATVTIVRSDDPDYPTVMSFGYEDAERASLLSKANWQKYGPSMSIARAISKCARAAAEDALGGARYTPEELGATVDEAGEVINLGHVDPDPVPSNPQPVSNPVDDRPAPTAQPKQPAPAAQAAPAGPAPVDAPPSVPAAAQVPDDQIIASVPTAAIQHAKAAWANHTKGDEEALLGVCKSAQSAKMLAAPALGFNELGQPMLYGRDEQGAPISLNVMLRALLAEVRELAAAAVASEQDAAAEEPQAAPDEHVAASAEPDGAPDPQGAEPETVEGELMDGDSAASA